ncbi:hypothetical protein ACR6C2_33455 [Streptomyces sp. INA 01156]
MQVHTIATSKPHAILYLAPVISPLTGASGNNSINYVTTAAEAKAGEMTVADSGNVAAVRLKLDGEGDAALLVGVGEAGPLLRAGSRSPTSPRRSQIRCSSSGFSDQRCLPWHGVRQGGHLPRVSTLFAFCVRCARSPYMK